MRRPALVIVLLLAAAAAAAILHWPSSTEDADRAAREEVLADDDEDQDEDRDESAAPEPTQAARAAEALDRARRRQLAQLAGHLGNSPVPPGEVAMGGPIRRRTETPDEHRVRLRFLEDYRRFLDDAKLTPEQDYGLRRVFADAQDNWRLAWKALGTGRPFVPERDLMDEKVRRILQSVDDEARGRAGDVLTGAQLSIMQSEIPIVTPIVQTAPFVSPKPAPAAP